MTSSNRLPLDSSNSNELISQLYFELKKIAASQLASEKTGQPLQTTALVHEAFLRMRKVNNSSTGWANRQHFFACAAIAMRQILVDQARRRNAVKHGSGLVQLDLNELNIEAPEPDSDLLALNEALDELKQVDGTAFELVHLRYFAGMNADLQNTV